MSQENQRTIAERAGVRWPSIAPRTMQWALRLPPGSRLRKGILERFARTAFLSWNRGDYALVPIIDHPEVEVHFTVRDLMVVGSDDIYYGPDGHCQAMENWNEAWREWDADIDQVIDEGSDQVLIVARLYGEGAASGIRLDDWAALRYTFREGRILRIDGAIDADRDRVLNALGATEAARLSE
jgi:ketosteroid isomerase-like protein